MAPPRRKDLLKPSSKSKAKDPVSENDFLESADEFEQAAGKWRAGDAAKASRFFNRAIDMYNAGLQRYPNSFDLAYNKANLQYNMSEDSRIAALLGNRLALLEETLQSHRVALGLNPENTDVLFNTAQVLTSSAEALLDANGSQEPTKSSARPLLEEAVQMFAKCLAQQQQEYEEMRSAMENANAQSQAEMTQDQTRVTAQTNQDAMETASNSSDAPEEWATVMEPVTPETILDSCIAQLGALTTLIGLYDIPDSTNLDNEVNRGLDIINHKIPAFINLLQTSALPAPTPEATSGPTLSIASSTAAEEPKGSTQDEALLAATNFQAALLEASYRRDRISATDYLNQITSLFSTLEQNTSNTSNNTGNTPNPALINAHSAHADALTDLSTAISDSSAYNPSSPTYTELTHIQWTALTTAQTLLTSLTTLTPPLPPSRLATIFLARGDTELFRFRLSLSPSAKPAWMKSKAVLVGNAGVYYRGSRSYAERAGLEDVRRGADARAIVAEVLKEGLSGNGERKGHWKGRREDVGKVLEMMVEEGVVGRENVDGVMGFLV